MYLITIGTLHWITFDNDASAAVDALDGTPVTDGLESLLTCDDVHGLLACDRRNHLRWSYLGNDIHRGWKQRLRRSTTQQAVQGDMRDHGRLPQGDCHFQSHMVQHSASSGIGFSTTNIVIDAGTEWNSGQEIGVTLTDSDANTNSLDADDLAVSNPDHVIPTITIGEPLTLTNGLTATPAAGTGEPIPCFC